MTEKQYNEQDKKITEEMFKELEKNYAELELDIPEPKYDKKGNLKNEKEIKNKLKLLLPVFLVLWTRNITITEDKSVETMIITNTFINTLKKANKLPKTMITTSEWQNIMKETLKKRNKQVKIKQVINGNARVLNKQVQKIVNTMYKDGKSWVQTKKVLQNQFGYNERKAKSIAITEKNFYKSEAQLQAIDNITEKVDKIWVHNRANDPRPEHLHAHGEKADKKGYFHIGGRKTKAPQHFGVPNQDINCHCTMRLEIKNEK